MRSLSLCLALVVVSIGIWSYADRMDRFTLQGNEPKLKYSEPVPNPLPECRCKKCRCGEEEVILDSIHFLGKKFFVTERTETFFNGQPCPWFEIPDGDTEPTEVGINLRTNRLTKIAYHTKKKDA